MNYKKIHDKIETICVSSNRVENMRLSGEVLIEIAKAIKDIKNMKCCGNCAKMYSECYGKLAYTICNKWVFDGIDFKTRKDDQA